MTVEEKNRLNKSLYYHEGCLEFRKNQLKTAQTESEIENVETLIKYEETKIDEIKTKLGYNLLLDNH